MKNELEKSQQEIRKLKRENTAMYKEMEVCSHMFLNAEQHHTGNTGNLRFHNYIDIDVSDFRKTQRKNCRADERERGYKQKVGVH